MPVELRKRKPRTEPAPPPPAKKRSNPVKKAADKAKAVVTGKSSAEPAANGASNEPPTVGSVINLEGFGGDVETHEGSKTTLAQLVADSKNGVVLFTYPKASTPGCTKQACMFRDDYKALTSTGLAIYGLSRDSPTANTTFFTKQALSYPLLCDPAGTLISAIGMKKAPSGTTRGVFVVDKNGKVLAAEPGSPDATVQVVRRLVGSPSGTENAAPMEGVTHTGAAEPAPKVEPHPIAEPAPAVAPSSSTIEKKPLTETPAESAAKQATVTDVPDQSFTNMSVPGGALANPAKDAAVAQDAAAVADSADKVDPPVANPGSTGPAVPGGAMINPAKDAAVARVAAEVADVAQKIDPATPDPA